MGFKENLKCNRGPGQAVTRCSAGDECVLCCCVAGRAIICVCISASKSSIRRVVITEKAPTRAFSWLNAATTAFTFKTLLRHYAKRALTPRSLNVKLGPQRNYHKGRAAIRHYSNQTAYLKCESGSSRFQPGEGPSRGLLRDYEPSDGTF